MWGRHKFAYEELNQTVPNQITWNQTMQGQTKACIVKSSCEIALFWDITQRRVVIPYWQFGQPINPNFKGQDIQKKTGHNWS